MKKLYAFLAAALVSASTFAAPATVPTVANLAGEYDVTNNVVLCLYFDEEVCNDVVLAGSYNEWATDPTTMKKFAPLTGFEGWYAVEFPFTADAAPQGKPVQLKKDGSFSWDFQSGDAAAWIHKGGNTATINPGYSGECDLSYPLAGAYIYEVAYFKNHNSPCVAEIPHTYTVKVYAPDACADMKPAIIGGFNNWSEGVAMTEDMDENFETVYSYTFASAEGQEFKIKEATDTDWTNQMQYYVDSLDQWKDFDNYKLGADTVIVLDYSDNTKFRFSKCNGESAQQVVVGLVAPAGAPAAGIDIIGTFDGWAGTPMMMEDGVYAVMVSATASDQFKFREAGTWDNEILTYDAATAAWVGLPNMPFGDYWVDGGTLDPEMAGTMVITLDYSDPAMYAWKVPQGIEEVVLTEKAQKVIVDGVLYIVRDNKMYNVQGTQVR